MGAIQERTALPPNDTYQTTKHLSRTPFSSINAHSFTDIFSSRDAFLLNNKTTSWFYVKYSIFNEDHHGPDPDDHHGPVLDDQSPDQDGPH